MLDSDYKKFVVRYQKLRLGSMDDDFVILWRSKLESFDIADLLGAVTDVAADTRMSFPLNDLPLLIEHASNRRDARQRASLPLRRFDLGPKEFTTTAEWDRRMVMRGTITPAEAKRRERERKAKNGGP